MTSQAQDLEIKHCLYLTKLTSLEADAKNCFNVLLDIMEECGNDDVRDIVIDVRRTLMTGEVTVNDHTYLHTCITARLESIMLHNLLIMLFGISPIFCLLCSFLCFLGMHYADNLYL